ncbi:MAG TPA: histidine kinase [Sulfurimonas sp. UBA12504]|nr:MAG TPA: histidine kinase [Sulfurimonas sp. UBA12504]
MILGDNMQIETLLLKNNVWEINESLENSLAADLVMVFGDTEEFVRVEHYDYLRNKYPNAHIAGCSSSGNIMGAGISESKLVATAVKFDTAKVILKRASFEIGDAIESISKELAGGFEQSGLKHLFVLADGLNLNGSDLVNGFNRATDIPTTGGLAGDGARFEQTWVMADGYAQQKIIVALGFYGDSLSVGSGCYGGWSEFGTFRNITKSKANVLFELDGRPALDLYKEYLGEYASDLPHSGLRFPLSIRKDSDSPEVIRTLLGINEEDKSIIFAGNVPEGYTARLMKPNIELLIEGAGAAAEIAKIQNEKTALGLVVSCVGRKLVMSQLIDEELEAVAQELGENVQLTGFYSYGEIAPFESDLKNCQLHNQTMTLTVIYEK